ncbi:hypothetical protein TMatcc_001302 [Talaromyces marneffei ATCC 18224]
MVISTGDSWRIKGLRNASRYTGLDIEVPYQPQWPLHVVESFRRNSMKGSTPNIGIGQTQCWLGHLNVLQEIVHRSFATALVFEDDVDWDVDIKYELALVSPLIRQVWSCDGGDDDKTLFGSCWDILWLGHCGDIIASDALSVWDYTSLPSGFYQENDDQLTPFPARTRMVHVSQGPICTYAYAVTNKSAAKLVQMVGDGVDETTSTQFRLWCQNGRLRCITVSPELFHHHKSKGQLSSNIALVEGWEMAEVPIETDFTKNIRYSSRCSSRAGRDASCEDST